MILVRNTLNGGGIKIIFSLIRYYYLLLPISQGLTVFKTCFKGNRSFFSAIENIKVNDPCVTLVLIFLDDI